MQLYYYSFQALLCDNPRNHLQHLLDFPNQPSLSALLGPFGLFGPVEQFDVLYPQLLLFDALHLLILYGHLAKLKQYLQI